ncbi:hypothetical protein CSM99_003898 [Salmonella enterica subsp. diarizonae]|nr:hypothetical protein [Salmonella enterica]EDV2893469.1 hypothetical protein [Salmonella enterica subsp. diarizonae]
MLNRFFLFMLPLNMLVSVVNDQSLSIWWLMFLACGFIVVFAIEKRRYSAEMIAHDKYIVEVQYEILEGLYRKRFKNILQRNKWAKPRYEGAGAIAMAQEFIKEWLHQE